MTDSLREFLTRDHASEAAQVRRALGLLRSIIQSGESWTETAQREYDAALNATRWLEDSHG